MANVKVAIRVRPLSSRESADGGRIAVQVKDKVVRVRNVKLDGRVDGRAEVPGDSRERLLEFGFDYCYWSVNPEAPNYASQEEVFQDLGVSVLAGAAEGYNICLFAYGQTGSGKTHTMMGTPDSIGLTPRICQGLFQSDMDSPDGQNCRVEISFLEIYNERVRDLLRGNEKKKPAPLRVREHPEKGPYVQGLSQHVVSDYKQTVNLLEEGIANRITAATHVHDASSRSHAIFSIQYTQAILENNLPSEIVSKINLVDLAGSERADPQYCRDRITEGANINKSLVTLGIVISALAQNSQMCSSSQSINSMLSEGEGSTMGSHSSSLSSSGRRHCFIPYRDSVLTWLLKDSLGGNSKTIMIATISPSYSSYNETLSTLRYAAHARNIVNKPRVNEDASVRLIRELREEIDRLKSMLLSFSMQRNPSPSLSDERDSSFSDIVLQNELKVEQLTKDWSESWQHKRSLLEEYSVDINQDRAGVQIHSLLPHLVALEPDVLSTGVTIYHLREGVTRIGPRGQNEEDPHIVLPEGAECEIQNQNGVVTLRPLPKSICRVNDREVTEPCRLAQGAVVTLGGLHKFRFNHPAEAAVLRERRRTSEAGLFYSSSFCTISREVEIRGQELSDVSRQRLEEQQRYVECLREEIQLEQRRAEKDLETEQAHLRQQRTEIQQWILQEKHRLAAIRERCTLESGVKTELLPLPIPPGGQQTNLNEGNAETVSPSQIMGVKKQIVHEELLKHHALRRAENRVRRKRLHYQLERIARKRHLLEAKRELQRLENTLPLGGDGPSSPELGSPSKCRGRAVVLRRHSLSGELLSRLYPQQAPFFRQLLRRNRSSESTSSLSEFTCPRKWVSDECLPDQKTRGRSNTMPSRFSQGTSSRQGSSENLKILQKEERPDCEMIERKTLTSQPEVSARNCVSAQSAVDSNNGDTQKVLPIIKQSHAPKGSSRGAKNVTHGGSKGLERIRKALSRSVGSGIKIALSRVFRKPPLGLRGGRGGKFTSRAKAQIVGEGSKNTTVGETETKPQKCSIKTTVSCEGLEQLISGKDMMQRRWHSAETLTQKTKKWVKMQQELTGCEENDDEEDIDGSSDCDSLFSVDSLSSAYAMVLAEQLKREECEPSEAESEDSQMSKDSLVMESSGKHITARQAMKPRHSLSHSFQPSLSSPSTAAKEEKEKPKEMPAEAFWSLCGRLKPVRRNGSQGAKECSYISEIDSRPSSNTSVKDPENLLVLTDAWSSTDAADSPRSLKVSESLMRQTLHKPAESNSSQSSDCLDLSSTINESEDQISPRSDTIKGSGQVSSEMESNLDSYCSDPDSKPCPRQESTLLHENHLLLSNYRMHSPSGEPCSMESMKNASIDVHEKDAPMINNEVPQESLPLQSHGVDVFSAFSKEGDLVPGSLGRSQDKSLGMDMQINVFNEAYIITSGAERSSTKKYASQEELTKSKQKMQLDGVLKYDGHVSLELQHCDHALQTPAVSEHTNNQSFTSSNGEFHHTVMQSVDIDYEVLSETPHSDSHKEKSVDDGKILQYKDMTDVPFTEEVLVTGDTKNGSFTMYKKPDNPSEEADIFKHCDVKQDHAAFDGPRNKLCHDVSTQHPKGQCVEAHALSDFVVEDPEAMDLDSSNIRRDTTEKLSIEKQIPARLSSVDTKANLELDATLPNVNRNTLNQNSICSAVTPAFTAPQKQDISGYFVNKNEIMKEVKYDPACDEVTDSQMFDEGKCQKTGWAVSEKISEVVKEHLSMSLDVDGGEEVNRETETNRSRFPATGIDNGNVDEVKMRSCKSCLIYPCTTESPVDDDTKTKRTSCSLREEDLFRGYTGEETLIHNKESDLISNGPSVEDLTVDFTVPEPICDHLDSVTTAYQNGLTDKMVQDRSLLTQSTVMSAYKLCPEVNPSPESITFNDITKDETGDHCALNKSDTTSIKNAWHTSAPIYLSTPIRSEDCEVPPVARSVPEFPSSLQENGALQVLHRMEDNIDNATSGKVNIEGMPDKSYMDDITDSMKTEFLLMPELSDKAGGNFQTSACRSSHNAANQDSASLERSGKYQIVNSQSHLCVEQDTNSFQDSKDNKSRALKNSACSGERIAKSTSSVSGQAPSKSCIPSQPCNQTNQTFQRVMAMNGTTYNCLQPEDQTICNGDHKHQRTKIQAQSKTFQAEQSLNQLQAQESSICTASADLAEGANQLDTRMANKPDLKSSSSSSEKAGLFSVDQHKFHHDITRSTEKVTSAEDHARIISVRSSCCSCNNSRQRVKPRKYRRAHFTAPLSSSTDSPDSSLDDIGITRVHSCSSANLGRSAIAVLRKPNVAQNRSRILSSSEQHISSFSAVSPKPVESRGNASLEAGTSPEVTIYLPTNVAKKHCSNSSSSKLISPERQQSLKTSPMTNGEPVLHFASSDINPFIHARKSEELLKSVYKNQAFGSAVNISSQVSQLDVGDKRITRCCSVDNGLNIQNSPFNSHLSTYATDKRLSSTLSSVEDSKEHTSQLSKDVHHTSLVSSDKTLEATSCDSYNDTSDLGHSSGQVDEIVLVYSSEHETQESVHQKSRKCDSGTQTSFLDEELKKKSRHRRSSAHDHVSKQQQPTTWASLQNMSEHLSELIHNTSDLLGNIQCMRTGDKNLKYEYPVKNCSQVLKTHSDELLKRDGSTQTTVDIGIQTEAPLLMKESKVVPQSPSLQNKKSHEVSVIVKVIGSDVCNGSKPDQYETRQSFETIKSMPDLRPKAPTPSEQMSKNVEVSASKVLSLETVLPNQNYPNHKALTANTVQTPQNSPKCFGRCTSEILAKDKQVFQMKSKPKYCPERQVLFMDRASSPILTVDVLTCSQKGKAKPAQCLPNHGPKNMDNPHKKQISMSFKNSPDSKQRSSVKIKALPINCSYKVQNENKCEKQSVSSASLQNLSDLNSTNDEPYSESTSITGRYSKNGRPLCHGDIKQGMRQPVLCSPPSPSHSSSIEQRQHEDDGPHIFLSSTPISQKHTQSTLQNNHRVSQDSVKCWSDLSHRHLRHQEEDAVSLAPSECNTDILLSINPLPQTSPAKEDRRIPEDLPMHNKFTNWSGISQQPLNNEGVTKPRDTCRSNSESRHKPETDKKTREIARLRKEREQVLASVRLDLSPQHLSVELTEAKLHYGLGETDTLLKMLQSSPREETETSTRQQLYDRHRRSIDGLKKEREARIQNCRRARSLSPSKLPNPPGPEVTPQRPSDLPSRRREYLQQLRQEVVQMSRVPDPVRREGQCPSDIEVLLRDYSRAREEARTEIARARERLRERTEQEKRRLQQQALAQAVKDDLRLHTRFSNSTLCTGSNLSLSSGPTSGYNSSNAALLKDSTSPPVQITGVPDAGFRVRTRPPLIPPQSVKAQRAWLSAQDIRLETFSSGCELQPSSSPSSPPARQRTFSFGSPSTLSTSYQDIADCTLSSAVAEVNLASGGDLRNLLAGKAAAGWRYQGTERGVQTFHRPSSKPSAHGFLGAMVLERPLASLWRSIRDHSKTHLYNESVRSAWTRPVDDSTQLVYLLTDPSSCQLKQPRDFCCLSTESKQEDMWVLAMQSVFEESLPRPSVDTIRGEMFPSAWILQPFRQPSRDLVLVVYLLQVDLGSPSLPQKLQGAVARKQASVISDLDSFLSVS
ncbi:stAR-related lipid transfer protein 9 [Hoplias malabaricus]|uniref:stAR-related lipid transfer protein 9 n=1 Tax=Hoplias malabaricus TaxID=27720 RepID=UPI0034626595